MNENKFWGPHPLENIYATDWCQTEILDGAFESIEATLFSKTAKFAEIRAAAFMLHKLADWFKDLYELNGQFDQAIKRLNEYAQSEEVTSKYEVTIALKNQIDNLVRFQKENFQ
jgi:predicted RNA-binding Zn ribbon-like protein